MGLFVPETLLPWLEPASTQLRNVSNWLTLTLGDRNLAGVNIYKMKTALAQHVENDPLYECKDYDENNSFDHCIDKELEVCI